MYVAVKVALLRADGVGHATWVLFASGEEALVVGV